MGAWLNKALLKKEFLTLHNVDCVKYCKAMLNLALLCCVFALLCWRCKGALFGWQNKANGFRLAKIGKSKNKSAQLSQLCFALLLFCFA